MSFSSKLTQVASKIEKKPIMALCALLVMLFAIETVLAREMSIGQHTAIRRLDCSVFCRKTGFSGYVGGCQCGFTLFANKRSQLVRSRLYQSPTTKLIYPENNNYLSDDESGEEGEMGREQATSKDRQGSIGSRCT